MATMKIPNKAVLSLMVVFLVIGLIALPFWEYLWRWSHFAVVLAIGFVMASLGAMGAGDAKYMAAMAPFIDLDDLPTFMFLLAATIMGAIILHRLARASFIRKRFDSWESWTHKGFPMGFALAPALMFYLMIALFN